ncbi:hypothetical protein ABT282_07935 [Streptomyces sp. NPDC000927]|uniref:Acb2/Tad1 domain-containing protein n=1 Tax=Streptomyces sp. NPDC000927 TaxID=3154371 RepID=UPI003321CD71
MNSSSELDNWFSHHPPTSDQVQSYVEIRKHAREFAEKICALCPAGDDRKVALEGLRATVMWANASIACDSGPVDPMEALGDAS